ncbi:hypothetical protein GLOIN_2v1469349 [Rhizophagus irregularis DAOM 181602=DAOM 197198]|nr:hypothetical protein GLOIN_2v1469349 [Rhizophagus irregularis DAOM 181602=DAOM 197198]CAG8522923.1 16868_t:CDS:2 [Rhizophagus irregularis]
MASQNIPTPVCDLAIYLYLYWTPAADTWKRDLQRIGSLQFNTEIEAWGYIGCLEYLAKVGVHLTLEDRDDILGRYRNHLHSIFSSTLTLKKAKDKAYKLNYAAERSFKRVEVTSFFKKLDTLRTAIWNGYFGFFKKPPFSKELIRTLIAVSRISLRII